MHLSQIITIDTEGSVEFTAIILHLLSFTPLETIVAAGWQGVVSREDDLLLLPLRAWMQHWFFFHDNVIVIMHEQTCGWVNGQTNGIWNIRSTEGIAFARFVWIIEHQLRVYD